MLRALRITCRKAVATAFHFWKEESNRAVASASPVGRSHQVLERLAGSELEREEWNV
jgi:hypothetical protein